MANRWMVILLWLGCLGSALLVVDITHQVRRDTNQLEGLRRHSAELQVQWGQYLLEESTWASYSRVETEAVKGLGMKVPEANKIIIVGAE